MSKENIIQITDEQADLLLSGHGLFELKGRIKRSWKEKGFIKKSALEEAREIKRLIESKSHDSKYFFDKNFYLKTVNLYEKAIEEIQGAKDEI